MRDKPILSPAIKEESREDSGIPVKNFTEQN